MSEGQQLEVRRDTLPAEFEVSQVSAQVQKVQQLMKDLMIDGEHYGTIPGTTKKTLLKPGAEKLCFIFRLAPQYEVITKEIVQAGLPAGHREVTVTCSLCHSPTGVFVAEGVGSCSTMESKYRYREDKEFEELGPVPKEYWKLDDEAARDELTEKLHGPGKIRRQKVVGQWMLVRYLNAGKKVENPDIADVYNTVLKMAKKRAHSDATLSATAASDLFTQDMDDSIIEPTETHTTTAPAKPATPPAGVTKGIPIPQLLNTRIDGMPVFAPKAMKEFTTSAEAVKDDPKALADIRGEIEKRIEGARVQYEGPAKEGQQQEKRRGAKEKVEKKDGALMDEVKRKADAGEVDDVDTAGLSKSEIIDGAKFYPEDMS